MTIFDNFWKWEKGGIPDPQKPGNMLGQWAQNADGDDIVPGWYFGIIIFTLIAGIIGAIILGSYINGARWINKRNARVEGKEFVRSSTQRLVYKLMLLSLATLILFTGYIGSIDGTLNRYKNGENWAAFIPFFRSQGSLLYQCNIASIFVLPWLMYFNKVKAIAIIAPFTFLGASSTVFSQTDLADGNGFNGFEVHRKAIEHLCLMIVPLFVMVANRFQYTTKSLLGAFLYITIFNAIVAFGVYFGWHDHFSVPTLAQGETLLPNGNILAADGVTIRKTSYLKEMSQGEFFRAAEMVGKDEVYVAKHFWLTVILILGPITFMLSAILWIVYNFIFYASVHKLDASKSKKITLTNLVLRERCLIIMNKRICQPEINFNRFVSAILWFFKVLGFKIIFSPVNFVKTFKQVEKDAWTSWINTKSEIISK